MNKLPIKDILAPVDMGALNIWDELFDEEKKQVSFLFAEQICIKRQRQ